jgi:hypothetical protein
MWFVISVGARCISIDEEGHNGVTEAPGICAKTDAALSAHTNRRATIAGSCLFDA